MSEIIIYTSRLDMLMPGSHMVRKPSVEMTFSELADRWRQAVVPTLKATTANYYQKLLRADIEPAFGKHQISSIGRYDVEVILAEQAKQCARNSPRGMRVSLGRVLS